MEREDRRGRGKEGKGGKAEVGENGSKLKSVPNNGTKLKSVPNNGSKLKSVPNNGSKSQSVPNKDFKNIAWHLKSNKLNRIFKLIFLSANKIGSIRLLANQRASWKQKFENV